MKEMKLIMGLRARLPHVDVDIHNNRVMVNGVILGGVNLENYSDYTHEQYLTEINTVASRMISRNELDKKKWKIMRDPFYSELYLEYGLGGIERAGFFFDTSDSDVDLKESVRIKCTPVSNVYNAIKGGVKNPCILLSTGSFCPAHDGHIDMMNRAKKAIEEDSDYNVVAGYLSPGHDEYISAKNKAGAIPIAERLSIITDMIKGHAWLDVDPWEGVFCKVAVNFTDVITRMEMYLKHHFTEDIPVFFVCGGDQAHFSSTFSKRGKCIVVGRPNSESEFMKYRIQLSSDNILFAHGNNQSSSTEIRKSYKRKDLPSVLLLRTGDSDLREASIIKELEHRFDSVVASNPGNLLEHSDATKYISMDSIIRAEHNLEISRKFDLFGHRMLGYSNRPGSPDLDAQIENIPVGEYILFDDDVHTGGSIKFARNLLESKRRDIKAVLSLKFSTPEKAEILDCRDFLIGNNNSGLVVMLPNGNLVRVPYIYPYVCPYARASIHDPLEFSIEIWRINEEYFKNETVNKFSSVKYSGQTLWYNITGVFQESMYEICKWHRELLENLKQ